MRKPESRIAMLNKDERDLSNEERIRAERRAVVWLVVAICAAVILAAIISVAQSATITIHGCAELEVAPGTAAFICRNPTTPPPVDPPPPPVTVGLERFDAVPGDSDFARWNFWQSKEFAPLQARLMKQNGWSANDAAWRINQQINAYQSTIRLPGRYRGNNVYECVKIEDFGTWTYTPDVKGACDAYIAQRFPNALPYGELK